MLTDKFGMSFYKLIDYKYDGFVEEYEDVTHISLDTGKPSKDMFGHNFTIRKKVENYDKIHDANEKRYADWVLWRSEQWFYNMGQGMPRTPRETRMIQAQLDGVNGWWNVK